MTTINLHRSARQLIEVWNRAKQLERDELYSHEKHIFWILLRLAKESDRILEVGVGKGRMVNILRERGVTAEFYAVDVTMNVKHAPAMGVQGDARALPFRDDTFHLVYSLGVIEHFPETLQALKEHTRVAKLDGYVFIIVPNVSLSGLYSKINYFLNRLLMRWSGNCGIVCGRRISMLHMMDMASLANLKVVMLHALPPTLPYGWRLKHVEQIAGKVLSPKRWGAYLFLLAKKRVGS